MKTLGFVLLSWLQYLAQFIREATAFYYRLFSNKIGLPRWLWLLVSLSLIGSALYPAFGR